MARDDGGAAMDGTTGVREDFDFVSMANYEADTRDLVERSAHITKELRKDSDFWQQLFWKAVAKAGGRLDLDISMLQAGAFTRIKGPPGTAVEYHPDRMLYRFTVAPPIAEED